MMKNKLKNSGLGCLIITSAFISNNTLSGEYGLEDISLITANEYLREQLTPERIYKYSVDTIANFLERNYGPTGWSGPLGLANGIPSLAAVRYTYGQLGNRACLNSGAKNVDSSTLFLGVNNHSSNSTNHYVISAGTPYKIKSKHHGGLSTYLYKYYYSFRVDESKRNDFDNYTSTLIDNGDEDNDIVYTFTEGRVDINATVFSDEGSGWFIGVESKKDGGDLNHELDVSFPEIKFGGDLYELWECGSTSATVEINTAPNIDNVNIDTQWHKQTLHRGERRPTKAHYTLLASGAIDKHTVDGNLSYSWNVDGKVSYGQYLTLPDTTPDPIIYHGWGRTPSRTIYPPNTTVRNVKLIISDGHLSKIINVDGSSTFNTTTPPLGY